jgi:MOSC domain-containing protein YiiM
MDGKLAAIYIASQAQQPMQALEEAQLIPGRGIEGDRYFQRQGTFFKEPAADREVTLIESEAIEAMARECAPFSAAESRRNLVTRGVRLNHLVGREFQIGTVRLKGLRLCHPCAHLTKLTGKQVLVGLAGRGGLRAQVLNQGTIRVGDCVYISEEAGEKSVYAVPI